jgi:DNA polymerase-3 subunit gamma/tau
VDDVREIIKMAQTKAVDAEYKIFIVDEAHMITVQGWNAFLKTIEEPPAKVVFIFCTTDPQRIPPTVLSRVQRFQFQKISNRGIVERLEYIIQSENSCS